MQALDQDTTEYRRPPQPILTGGDDDSFDDDRTPRKFCQQCYRKGHDDGEAYGYDRGFSAGAASVRKAPIIAIDWSTTVGGIVNMAGFVLMMFVAMWIGEMRGMKSEGRLNITFSDGSTVPEKVSAAESPLAGTIVTGTLDGQPLTIRMKGASD